MDDALIQGTSRFKHYNTQAPDTTRILPLFSLKGKTAIVAGAGAGIGLAVCRGYAEAGANVIIWYNSNKAAEDRAQEIEDEFGVRCRAYSVDVTNPEAVDTAITSQLKDFNDRLDIFVYNSGVAWTSGAAITGSLDNYRSVMKVNVDGLFYCARVAGRIWREQKQRQKQSQATPLPNFRAGSFIATASMSGHIANFPQLQTAYDASKAAVKHMCQNLALEWVQFARVNSISPGYIATELTDFVPTETKEVWRSMIPMGREGEVGELKGPYLFLASDASSYCTGTDLLVDGGYCAP
ncbi:uncharacterized protein HMPREF1541_10327 [Cyphellophora europaea CBS 101466]|uniref:L-xylulose reductase n=1 Tax=Cyphellophora europaea (strain CBS 101466) TaxID=1220924 RepID=W2S7J4_CYPE1|nr:uncharacterized protein HMPREF1541_10327 [Cyphellophora europaea CBS 101466]ETN44657.1 hypothetical protein HMPREF1541_10327 [Cyphellophora europaea CBS 101466]